MKRIEFNINYIEQKNENLYREYIHKTSKLLNRPFIVVFKMVEQWEPSQVAYLYDTTIQKWRERGFRSPQMMWWTERKKISTRHS